MKKIYVVVPLLFFLLSNIVAEDWNGKRVYVVTPDTENFSQKNQEATWLPGSVCDRLESNFSAYTKFTIVDKVNESKIKKIQRESGSSHYDESTSIELGKLTNAQYALFSVIRKTEDTYSLTANFTNLTTGEKVTIQIAGKTLPEELYQIPGCAADELTVKLCDAIGIPLSESQRYVLAHGDEDLSLEKQIQLTQQTQKDIAEQIKKMELELSQLNLSTDLSANAKKAKLEAEIALKEGLLKAAQLEQERLVEISKQKMQDEIDDAKRTSEQKKKRDELAELAENAAQKAKEVRKTKFDNSSLLSQITEIEMKKKTLIEIRENVEKLIAESNALLDEELQDKIQEVNNQPYRIAEMDAAGNPTAKAKQNRAEKIVALKKEYEKRKIEEDKKIRSLTLEQENALLKEIRSDYKTISKTRSISSNNENLKYIIGAYDGNTSSWNVQIYLYSDNQILAQQNIKLYYKNLSGLNTIPEPSDAKYESYLNDVEIWNSLFLRNVPVLTFDLDYTVNASSDGYPSRYEFNFKKLKISNTISGKLISTPSLSRPIVTLTMKPEYNILTKEEFKTALVKRSKEEQRVNFNQKYGNGGMTSLRGGPLFEQNGYSGFEIGLTSAMTPYLFIGGFIGDVKLSPEMTFKDSPFFLKGTVGINYRPRILYYYPSVYAMGGVGVISVPQNKEQTEDSKANDKKDENDHLFLAQGSLGIEIPFQANLSVYVQGNIYYMHNIEITYNIEVGLSLCYPDLCMSTIK